MKKNSQNGFSLIELLLVVVIIGVIAAIAIPSLQKSIAAAENGSALSALKTMQIAQSSLYAQAGRFGRLDEINKFQDQKLGTVSTNILTRGKYVYEMVPLNPTDQDLKNTYTIKLSRSIDAAITPYVVKVDQTGAITTITP